MTSRYEGDAVLMAGRLQIPVEAHLVTVDPDGWRGSLRGVPTSRVFDLHDSDVLRLSMPDGQVRQVHMEQASHAHESEFTVVPVSGDGPPPFS
ncbi:MULTISPECIES: hypothetical protein [unclassified Streptomyces]|uniref:hypothetical protein n=1 Tax=unclassified Streptomyces TaxID=2593676 RepID=UPI00225B0151|nr:MULTISPECIES: hypothetical protein [unclassified Streptomyces]MCX5144993.1 hypothetical protein [Streptomyces sp. NBC_00338]WRZ62759.1 hypothetical protein OG408_02220 [Streptomyces sp. NBC_01257]WSU56726.1 hypothetical protein OG450_02185 [Streptomyces sp. NBC_01104]